MENDLKTLENRILCVAIPLFFIIQNDKIESFSSIQISQMSCFNFVGNSNLKVETAGIQMKALNFVASQMDFLAMELTCVQLMLIGIIERCLMNYILKPFAEG